MKAAALPMRATAPSYTWRWTKLGNAMTARGSNSDTPSVFEERVEVRFHFGQAGYIAVEDVPAGRVYRQRNDENPTVWTRNRTRVRMLQNGPSRLLPDDCRTAADDGGIGGDEGNVDVPVGMELSGKPAGIEDQVVAFRRPAVEFHLRAALHPGDVQHLRVDVVRARAFVQQVRHQVGGQVVGVGHLLRREVVSEVSIAPAPSLECDTVLASSFQALLDGLVGQIRQLPQLLNQARPTAFTHSDGRDAGVIHVVQLVVAVGEETRYAGRRQGPCGSSPDNRDPSQRFSARLYHPT